MKKTLSFLAIGVILGILGTVVSIRQGLLAPPPPEFHEHADFALFLNGQRFDFSKDEFMNIEPCEAEETWIPSALAHVGEEGLKGAVDLHNNIGHIIHVHRAGITYRDFFASLDMEFTDKSADFLGKVYGNNEQNEFRFFVNGEEVKTIAAREIRDLDRTLITYGPKGRSQASIDRELAELTSEACIYSGLCPQRGEAPPEACGG